MELMVPLVKFGLQIVHMPATPFHMFCVMFVAVLRHTGVQRPRLGLFFQFGYQSARCFSSRAGAAPVLLHRVTYGLYAPQRHIQNILKQLHGL